MTNEKLRMIAREEIKVLFEEASEKEIKDAVVNTLKDEGGAAGLEPLEKAVEDLELPEGFNLKEFLDGLGEVGQHKDGDYILDDEETIKVVKEYVTQGIQIFLEESSDPLDEKKKKKKKKKGGKKDACYHKVKARYDVWPSAYASGALVKCRKVGAKNWGNKSKKNEGLEVDIDTIVNEEVDRYLSERCQKGYKTHPTRKTKKMFGRTYRNCVKAEESKDPQKEAEIDNTERSYIKKIIKQLKNSTKKHANQADFLTKLIDEEIALFLEKKRKLTSKPSSETSLRDWFKRKGAKGKKGGWVDCNTCRKDKKTGRKKCSACGRSTGEKRAKYPSCRPTPGACGKRGNYGKKSKSGKKG